MRLPNSEQVQYYFQLANPGNNTNNANPGLLTNQPQVQVPNCLHNKNIRFFYKKILTPIPASACQNLNLNKNMHQLGVAHEIQNPFHERWY